jgi:hypothetical protein
MTKKSGDDIEARVAALEAAVEKLAAIIEQVRHGARVHWNTELEAPK